MIKIWLEITTIAALLAASCVPRSAPTTSQLGAARPAIPEAERLFAAGRFDDASRAVDGWLGAAPDDAAAALLKGRLALLANHREDAEHWLGKALARRPADRDATLLLALAHYRRDAFGAAAPLFRTLGREARAAKLESFAGLAPYGVVGAAQVSRVPFVHTDPLPLVRARANGSEEVNFLIDTGAGEVILDTEFAERVGAQQFGASQGTFAGDQRGDVVEGRIDSLTLGEFEIQNVPVNILSTQRFSAAARGKKVDGILGTVLLSHFLSTIDYPGGELVLRLRTGQNAERAGRGATADEGTIVPFWLVGDHLIVAQGKVRHSAPLLFFVDTGAAGVGFTCPRSTLDEAALELPAGAAVEGMGGGGRVSIVPFSIDELSLGEAKERDIMGVFGPFPESLERREGFRIGGLISHQFFRPYSVTLDFDRMRLVLKRQPGAGA